MSSLLSLPAQPSGVPWPSLDPSAPNGGWPLGGDLPNGVGDLLDQVFTPTGPLKRTFGVVIIQGGKLVAERYEGNLPTFDDPIGGEACSASTKFLSWSMAKSMLHAVVGMVIDDGTLSIDQQNVLPEWNEPGDPRQAISIHDLLAMRDGLTFQESYTEDQVSHVIDMLFGQGMTDMAHYAALRPLAVPPGTRFNYSSGTSNLLSRVVANVVGPGAPYEEFLYERLFRPIGMFSATPGFDSVGTWVASTYVHATVRDFARFGLLYGRGGTWNGNQVLSTSWVDSSRVTLSIDPTDGREYSLQWWVFPDGYGTFACRGYAGQWISVSPALDLILVRVGDTPSSLQEGLFSWYANVIDCFGKAQGPS